MCGLARVHLDPIVHKLVGLRVFADTQGKMNLSIQQVGGSLLAVSQFTLAADMQKGFRPAFDNAEEPKKAEDMFQAFCQELEVRNIHVVTGRFGASMQVHLVNDGPVTIWLDF